MDGRPVNELSVEAWHELLLDVDADAANDAARDHYRVSTVSLKPAHILQKVTGDAGLGALRDVTAERDARLKAEWLDARGISEAEFDANQEDAEWVRAADRMIRA